MNSNSLNAFVEWLEEQPQRLKLHIVLLMANLMPGCTIDIRSDFVYDQFIIWLRAQSLCPAKTIGTSLAIKAIANFSVMDGILGGNQWKAQAKNMDLLIQKEHFEEEREINVKHLQERKAALQFHSAQAIKMKVSWKELCEQYFTNEALRAQLISTD